MAGIGPSNFTLRVKRSMKTILKVYIHQTILSVEGDILNMK